MRLAIESAADNPLLRIGAAGFVGGLGMEAVLWFDLYLLTDRKLKLAYVREATAFSFIFGFVYGIGVGVIAQFARSLTNWLQHRRKQE